MLRIRRYTNGKIAWIAAPIEWSNARIMAELRRLHPEEIL